MKTKNILLWMTIGGLFLVPFISFFVPSNMFFPFISGKGFVFRILIEVLFGLYAMLCVVAPEFRPKMSWVTKSVLLFAVAILVADLLSVNVYKSLWSNYERMEGFVLIFHLVLYYVVATGVLRTAKRWYQFFNISIGASVLMSCYGILQLLGKIPVDQGGVRLDATFGNASYLAIYLVFHIFLSLYFLAQTQTEKWQKWLYGIVAIFETGILYYTATRGAILGLIGGLILAAIIVAWKEKENKTLRKISYGALTLGVILIVGFIGLRNVSFVRNSPVLSRFSTISVGELQSQGRYFVWPMAVKGFLERPIFGWGQESFNFVFNKFYDPRMWNQEQWFDRAHDIVLDWLVAGGLVGFLAYVSMYVALLYYIWRKSSGMSVSEKGLLTGLVAAYIFNNIFVFDNLVSYILFFSILGYIHSRSTENFTPTGKFYERTFSPENQNYIFAPIIVVLVAAGIYFINVPAILTNTTLISAITPPTSIATLSNNLSNFQKVFAYNSFGTSEALEQLVTFSGQIAGSQQVSSDLKQQFYNLGESQVKIKIAKTPTDARYLLFAGEFYTNFGQYNTALTYLKQTLVESPNKPSIYFALGQAEVGAGNYDLAFNDFKTGYLLAPEDPNSQIIYAVGAVYDKKPDVLAAELAQIGTSAPMTDNRFLQAYATIGDYQTVINILTTRLQSDPTNMQYELSLASAYLQSGNKQKAIAIINQMIAQDPTFKTQGEQYIQQIQNQ